MTLSATHAVLYIDLMNPNKPVISVIIPHLNQPSGLENCLASLSSQTLERTDFEVIVVDNGSASAPEAVISRYPGTVLLQEARPGPGLARNHGAEAASGDILAFIDADCRAHPDWLRSAVHTLHLSPKQTILGGDVRIWRKSDTIMTALEAYESVFAYRFKLYIEEHGFCGTGNLVVRRPDFKIIGPFRGIDVAEDIDWGQRARATGYNFVYVPEMIVFHPARASIGELFAKWDRQIQHAINSRDKNVIWYIRWVFRAFSISVSPLFDWTKVVSSDRIDGVVPRMKAICILSAICFYRGYKMIRLLPSNKGVIWNRDSAIL